MTTDGWKWKVRGSCKLPAKDPVYRRSLYFFHGQNGIDKDFQRHVYARLDEEYVSQFFSKVNKYLQVKCTV